MFSRTTPTSDGAGPEHDPLPLRIATAVVVIGLIASGVTVIWRDVAAHSGELVPLAATHGALRQSSTVPASGSRVSGQPAASQPALSHPAAGAIAAGPGPRPAPPA